MKSMKFFSFEKRDPQVEKQKKWDEMSNRINRTIDGIGKYVDTNIKEPVIALNLLGIYTAASCEGHLDHGTFAPYIDVQAKEYYDKVIYVLDNECKE